MSNYHQSSDINSEAERLRLMSLTANEASATSLGELVGDGFMPSRILDAGCGTGDAFEVLKQTFPDAELIGVDQSEKATEVAQQRQLATKVIAGNILKLEGLEALNGNFDLVFVRNTLLHIPEPREAVSQMESVLNKGGRILAQEPDWDTADANWDDFAIFKKAMMNAMRAHGINPTIGQDLETVINNLDFRDVKSHAYKYKTTSTDDGWKVLEYLLEVSSGLIGPYLHQLGIDSTEVMLEKFRTAQQDPDNYFDTPAWVVVTGVK